MGDLPAYETRMGQAYCGDSMKLIEDLPDASIDLVMTSPPFALQRQKEYGNKDQEDYVDWLVGFARKLKVKLTPTGSFVLDLGGAYQKGVPVRSLYNYEVLLRFCKEEGYFLAEEFFWYNPAKLPSPIEWVNKRKIRVKDAVNTVWWFSVAEFPKASVSNVLVPYSERMKKLLKDGKRWYDPKERPSGHDISDGFGLDRGGAIPSNLLELPNTESTSWYMRACKELGIKSHPARFPARLPEFFIRLLTDPGDLVVDVFAGSNTTGEVAERLDRRWIAFELEREYVASSVIRFCDDVEQAMHAYRCILNGQQQVSLRPIKQPVLSFASSANTTT